MVRDTDGEFAQLVILRIGSVCDGATTILAGMDAERVEILHIADGDTVAETVTHHLILDFLPAFETLLDEHLGRRKKPSRQDDGVRRHCRRSLNRVRRARMRHGG